MIAPHYRSDIKVVVLGILVVTVALSPFWLNYSGLCWKNGTFLTHDRKVNSAITYMMSSANSGFGEIDGKRWAIHYKDLESFKNINPDCCNVGENIRGQEGIGPTVSLVDKLFGSKNDTVDIKFLRRFVEADGTRVDEVSEGTLVLDSCGNVVN